MISKVRLLPLLMAAAGASLLLAMWTGLYRAGWAAPQMLDHHPMTHGPLMMCGFLGTVISLEKARGLGSWWSYLSPALSAVGAVALASSADPNVARVAFAVAGLLLCVIAGDLLVRHTDMATALILAGSVAWLVGNLLWLSGRSIPQVVSWWIAFPVLIIVGERLELTKVLPRSPAARIELLAELSVYVAGLGLLFWRIDLAFRTQGVGLALIALWLLRHDLARRSIRSTGVYRYTAACLLTGFAWLAVSGVLLAAWGIGLSALRYDAVLHTILLGFVLAMIFGHMPIISPMLLGRQMAFDGTLYAPLVLLQVSLVLRLVCDLAEWLPGRSWAAMLNVAAVLVFLATTVRAMARGRRLDAD